MLTMMRGGISCYNTILRAKLMGGNRHFEHDPKLFQLEGTIKKLSAIIDSKARKDKSIRKPLQPATRLSLLYTIADVMNPWFQSKAEKWYTQVMEAGSDWNSNIPVRSTINKKFCASSRF